MILRAMPSRSFLAAVFLSTMTAFAPAQDVPAEPGQTTSAESAEPVGQAYADPGMTDEVPVTQPRLQQTPVPDATALPACTDAQRTAIRELGREFSLRFVAERFIGGQDIEHLVENCTFDGFYLEGVLHIRWRGALIGWNDYNVWGRFRTDLRGADAVFSPRGESESVRSFQFWGNIGNIGMSLVR